MSEPLPHSAAVVSRAPSTRPSSGVPAGARQRRRPEAGPQSPIPLVAAIELMDVTLMVLSLVAVFVAVNAPRMPRGLDGFLAVRVTLKNVLLLGLLGLSSIAVFRFAGLYDASKLRRWWDETRRVVAAVTVVSVLAMVFPATSLSGAFGAGSVAAFWLLAALALIGARSLRAALAGHRSERRRVLIVGTGPHAVRIHHGLCADARNRYLVLGFVDSRTEPVSPFLARRTLGTLDELEELLAREHVDEVHIGLPVKSQYRQIETCLRTCERVGVKATYRADIFETRIARPCLPTPALPLVEMQVAPEGWGQTAKRALDVVAALAALVLLSPLMLAVAVLIKGSSRGPVIYAQERYGLNRGRFRMLKFRTMVADADRLQASLESRNEVQGPVFKIANDPRVTRVGRILRRTSIDELPQLVNVLRGEMSLVGPRPLPLRDVARITRASDMRRFSVRPGLTCLWQVSGRSRIGFDEWVQLDLQYIDGWSLGLDLALLLKTLPAVVRGTGAA